MELIRNNVIFPENILTIISLFIIPGKNINEEFHPLGYRFHGSVGHPFDIVSLLSLSVIDTFGAKPFSEIPLRTKFSEIDFFAPH